MWASANSWSYRYLRFLSYIETLQCYDTAGEIMKRNYLHTQYYVLFALDDMPALFYVN